MIDYLLHKPAKVALVAVMRKLLGFIHAVVKNNSFWNNNYGDKPFIIFGYSISALITFEFVRGIMNKRIAPTETLNSGTKAPL